MSWRDVEPAIAEQRMQALRDRLAKAEEALSVQGSLFAHDPDSFAYRLSLESLQARRDTIQQELAEVASLRQTEVVRLSLEGERFPEHSAFLRDLAHVLSRAQLLFTSILQAITVGPTRRGPFAAPTLALSSLRLVSVFPSSFGMALEADTQFDMYGNSDVVTALEVLFALFSSSEDGELLMERSGELGPRVMTHYRRLLGDLADSGTSLSLSWRDPEGLAHSWEGRPPRLRALHEALSQIREQDTEIRELDGWLMGASLIRNRFEFLARESEEIIRGRVAKEAKPELRASFGRRTTVRIAETRVYDVATDGVRVTHTLLKIVRLEDEN